MLQGKTVQFDYQWFACPALRASVLLVTWARPLGRQLSSYEGERPLQPVLQCFWHQNDITRAQLLHNFYMHYWTYSIQPFGCRPQSAVHVVALAVFSGVMDPSWVPLSEFITELLYPGLFSAVWTGLLDLTPFHLRTWSTVFCMNVHSEYIVSSAHQVPIRERHTHAHYWGQRAIWVTSLEVCVSLSGVRAVTPLHKLFSEGHNLPSLYLCQYNRDFCLLFRLNHFSVLTQYTE